MSTGRIFGKTPSLLSRQALRTHRQQQTRFFSSSQPGNRSQNHSPTVSSPLLNLFSQNACRPSIRHVFSRQRATQRRLLSEKKPDISTSKDHNITKNLGSPAPAESTQSLTLSQRLKKLSREYGWTAVGVYFALSALDFPFCFLAVRFIGTERVGAVEHAVVNFVKRAIPFQIPEKWGGQGRLTRKEEEDVDGLKAGYDHGVREADKQNEGENASIWTQLALAYAVHKSFIFIRVPLTAAVLPKVVKTLRGWGWKIGNKAPKSTPT